MTNAPNTPDGNATPPQTPPPGPGPAEGAPAGLVSAESPDAKTMAMLCHLLAMLTGLIVPLIIWLIKKDDSPFVNQQGKEAVNFELTLLIGAVIGGVTACIFIGFIILAAVMVVNIVFGIMATIAVNKGLPYRYPVCIRFIK